jgi:hypothetical protein
MSTRKLPQARFWLNLATHIQLIPPVFLDYFIRSNPHELATNLNRPHS